ncbi:hypothetical protein GPN2_12291 [Streptomyces murinus]
MPHGSHSVRSGCFRPFPAAPRTGSGRAPRVRSCPREGPPQAEDPPCGRRHSRAAVRAVGSDVHGLLLLRAFGVGARRDGRLLPGGHEAGDRGDDQDGADHAERDRDADLGHRDARLVQGVEHQLHADEAEDHRQAVREVDQLLQQAAEEEVQLAQAHQGEGVGGEDDVRVLGQAEDRGDRVQGEQDVGGADGEHHDQHRGHDPLAVLPDPQLGAVVPVGHAEPALRGLQQPVLLELLLTLVVGAGLLDELPGGPYQEGAEEVEDPGEAGDDRGSGGDEHRSQHQGYEDADEQDAPLVERGNRELRHDQDEDEEVVDAQRLLGDVAREELAGRLSAAEEEQAEAEEAGQDDPDDGPDTGFFDRDLMGLAPDEEVDSDQGGQAHDGQDPQGHRDFHYNLRHFEMASTDALSLPEVSSTRTGADAPGPEPVRIDGYAAVREYSPPLRRQYPNYQALVK